MNCVRQLLITKILKKPKVKGEKDYFIAVDGFGDFSPEEMIEVIEILQRATTYALQDRQKLCAELNNTNNYAQQFE